MSENQSPPNLPGLSKAEAKGFEPTIPVGVFLSVFGVVVICAAFLDMDTADRLINAVSGLVLLAIGGFCYAVGRTRRRRRAQSSGS